MPKKAEQDPSQAGAEVKKRTRSTETFVPQTLTVDLPEDLRGEIEKVTAALGLPNSRRVTDHLKASVAEHLRGHQGKLGARILARQQAALAQAGLAAPSPMSEP